MRVPEFGELLDAAMPWEDGTVIMLRAYLDASERVNGVFCVAGAAFGVERAKGAEKEWAALFGGRNCHMADLHARTGQFEGISDAEADRLCRGAIAIINQYASHVVAISCDVGQVEPLLPTLSGDKDSSWLLDSHKGVYPCCLHWTMGAFGDLVGSQKIAYWMEAGDRYSGSAAQYLSQIIGPDGEPLRDFYAYGSHTFATKGAARLFEVADLVAWEWAKHVDRLGKGIRIRPSVKALMDAPCMVKDRPFVKTSSRYANHYSGWAVEKYMGKLQRLMAATSLAEVRAVIDKQE